MTCTTHSILCCGQINTRAQHLRRSPQRHVTLGLAPRRCRGRRILPLSNVAVIEEAKTIGTELAWGELRDVRLGKVIGTGSYGTVHEGEFLSKTVAVKSMRKGGARSRIARFQREAAILETLDVPQLPIARLLAKFETPRFVYLVLEKAEGECLSSFVRVC